jgi:flagellar biosynthesis GTPase FlhF
MSATADGLDEANDPISGIEDDLPPAPDVTEPTLRTPQQVDAAMLGGASEFARQRTLVEHEDLAETVEKFITTDPQGRVEVIREGPMEIPSNERGRMGVISVAKLKEKPIEDLIVAQWGGGEYRWYIKNSQNMVVTGLGGRLEIAGDIIPVSVAGRAWVRERKEELLGEDGRGRRKKGSEDPGVYDLIATMMKNASSPAEQSSAMLATFMQMQEQQRIADAARREREAEDRRKEETERRRREDEDRKSREKEREDERRARENERMAEIKARIDEMKEQTKLQIAEQKARAEAQIAEIQARTKAETELRLELIRSQAGGGLGADFIGKVREQMAAPLAELMLNQMDPPGEERPGIMDAVTEMIRRDGGELAKGLIAIVQHKMGVPAQPAGLPNSAPMLDVDVEAPVTSLTEPVTTEEPPVAPPATAAPPDDAARQIAMQKISPRIRAFVVLMQSEMLLDSDPDAAWDADQGDVDDLRTLFEQMPGLIKKGIAAEGWNGLVKNSPKDLMPTLQGVVTTARANPAAKAWIGRFFTSQVAPWRVEEEPADEVPVDEQTPDVAPDAAPPDVGDAPVGGEGVDGHAPEEV